MSLTKILTIITTLAGIITVIVALSQTHIAKKSLDLQKQNVSLQIGTFKIKYSDQKIINNSLQKKDAVISYAKEHIIIKKSQGKINNAFAFDALDTSVDPEPFEKNSAIINYVVKSDKALSKNYSVSSITFTDLNNKVSYAELFQKYNNFQIDNGLSVFYSDENGEHTKKSSSTFNNLPKSNPLILMPQDLLSENKCIGKLAKFYSTDKQTATNLFKKVQKNNSIIRKKVTDTLGN